MTEYRENSEIQKQKYYDQWQKLVAAGITVQQVVDFLGRPDLLVNKILPGTKKEVISFDLIQFIAENEGTLNPIALPQVTDFIDFVENQSAQHPSESVAWSLKKSAPRKRRPSDDIKRSHSKKVIPPPMAERTQEQHYYAQFQELIVAGIKDDQIAKYLGRPDLLIEDRYGENGPKVTRFDIQKFIQENSNAQNPIELPNASVFQK